MCWEFLGSANARGRASQGLKDRLRPQAREAECRASRRPWRRRGPSGAPTGLSARDQPVAVPIGSPLLLKPARTFSVGSPASVKGVTISIQRWEVSLATLPTAFGQSRPASKGKTQQLTQPQPGAPVLFARHVEVAVFDFASQRSKGVERAFADVARRGPAAARATRCLASRCAGLGSRRRPAACRPRAGRRSATAAGAGRGRPWGPWRGERVGAGRREASSIPMHRAHS